MINSTIRRCIYVLNEPYERLDQFSKMIISETVTSVRELPKKRDQVFYELILASVLPTKRC